MKKLIQVNVSNSNELKNCLVDEFSSSTLAKSYSPDKMDYYVKYFKSEILSPILTDRETLSLIKSMFENNLNVTFAAKATFMHRNTLMYRIEKIKTRTGLDLRVFEDACIIYNILSIYEKYSSQPV